MEGRGSKHLKTAQSFSPFAQLPTDLVHEIFSHLSQRQALGVRFVCRRWADAGRYHVRRVPAENITRQVSETFPRLEDIEYWPEESDFDDQAVLSVKQLRRLVDALGPRITHVRRFAASVCSS